MSDEELASSVALSEAPASASEFALRDGAVLAVERAPEGDVVRLTAPGAALPLFEYDTRTGTLRLTNPRGDLVLAAPAGAVRVEAARGFAVSSRGPVTLESARGDGARAARVRLEDGRVETSAPVIESTAREVRTQADEVRTVARVVRTTAESLRVLTGLLETRATRVVERATNVYREVEELSQLRAGSVRQLAREALHQFGKRVFVGAEDEVKVDGEHIRLG